MTEHFMPIMFAVFGTAAFVFGFLIRTAFVVISKLLGQQQNKPGPFTIIGAAVVFVGGSFPVAATYANQLFGEAGSDMAAFMFLIILAIGAFFFVMTMPLFFVGLYAAGPAARALAQGLVRLPGWLAKQAREGH